MPDPLPDYLLVALKSLARKPLDHEGWADTTAWLAHHNVELAERGLVEVNGRWRARVTSAGKKAAKQGYAGDGKKS